ncbi:MAG: carboxymuconolactone decarboxylase family protein [Nitrospinota bacterium]
MGLTEDEIDAAEDYESNPRLSEREKLAIRYCAQMMSDPQEIRGEFYAEMREHFTEAEIMELGVFAALNLGFHTFFSTLEFYPAYDREGRPTGAA